MSNQKNSEDNNHAENPLSPLNGGTYIKGEAHDNSLSCIEERESERERENGSTWWQSWCGRKPEQPWDRWFSSLCCWRTQQKTGFSFFFPLKKMKENVNYVLYCIVCFSRNSYDLFWVVNLYWVRPMIGFGHVNVSSEMHILNWILSLFSFVLWTIIGFWNFSNGIVDSWVSLLLE